MLEKFGMLDTKPSDTSMATTTKLDRDEGGISIDAKKYRGMIVSLLYLISTRPDIMFWCGHVLQVPRNTKRVIPSNGETNSTIAQRDHRSGSFLSDKLFIQSCWICRCRLYWISD